MKQPIKTVADAQTNNQVKKLIVADLFIGRVGVEAGIQLIYRYGFCFVFYVGFGGWGAA